ncbi:MAG: hypothetical protein P9X24_11690 [Candidatus Hatepunaea meridiana]|nr:hypothetical protein [Candidatus Hatepunaea meridiana]
MFTIAINGSYPSLPDPPRPPLLQRAIDEFINGRINEQNLVRAKQRAVIDAIAEMVVAGVEVVSDGQIQWDGGAFHICRGLSGFNISNKPYDYSEDYSNPRPIAVDPINWTRPILIDDYRFIIDRSPVDVRPVLPGPFSLARLCDSGIYKDDIQNFSNDIAQAINREILGLEALGVKYILIEEPLLTTHKSEINNFIQTADILCDNVTISIILGTSDGDILGIEKELQSSSFKGFALDMLDGTINKDHLINDKGWEERILQLGLVHSYNPDVERPLDIARELIWAAQYHNPELIWVAPTGGLRSLTRDSAFFKLKSLYIGAEKARQEIARQEEPGGKLAEG